MHSMKHLLSLGAAATLALCSAGLSGCTEHAEVTPESASNTGSPSSAGSTDDSPNQPADAPAADPPTPAFNLDVDVPAKRLAVDGAIFDIPDSWQAEVPSSSMRAAQFALPLPEGSDADPARVVVFRNIRGGIDANLQRWKGQLGGESAQTSVEIMEINGLTVHQFIGTGAFDAGRAMGTAPTTLDRAMVLGLALETQPGVHLYIKATAPKSILEPARASWDAFVASVRRDG